MNNNELFNRLLHLFGLYTEEAAEILQSVGINATKNMVGRWRKQPFDPRNNIPPAIILKLINELFNYREFEEGIKITTFNFTGLVKK